MAGPTVNVSVLADTKKFKKTFDKIGGATKGLSKAMRAVGRTAAAGIAVATAALTGFMAFSFKSLAIIDKLNAQTRAVLKSTRGASSKTFDQLAAQADQIERLTGVETEAVQAGQNMLLTFTQIKGLNFDRATQAAVDLSVAMGKDMASSAVLVGKALNDPIKGIGALSKVGVQLTQDQKDLIKQMVSVGDVAGAQRVILKELETQFGGSAEAFGNTFLGALAKAKNSFGTLGETAVSKFLEPSRLGLLKLDELFLALNENPAFLNLVDRASNFFLEFVKGAPTLETLGGKLSSLADKLDPLLQVASIVGPALGQIAREVGPELSKALSDLAPGLVDLLVALMPLLPPLVELALRAVPLLVGALNTLIPVITPILQFLSGMVEALVLVVDFLAGPKTLSSIQVFNDKMSAITGPFQEVIAWSQRTGAAIGKWLAQAVLKIIAFKSQVDANIRGVIAFFSGIPGKISGAIGNLGRTLYTAGRNTIQGFLDGAGSLLRTVGQFFLNQLPAWIRDPFSKAMGIASPSRLMKKLGRFTIQGLVVGINSGLGAVERVMGAVSNSVLGGYSLAGVPSGGGRRGGGNTYEIHLSTLRAGSREGRVIIESIEEFERKNGRRKK